MEYSDLEKVRLEKIHRMREKGIEPYPTRANPTHSSLAAKGAFEEAEAGNMDASVTVTIVGRLRSVRNMGKITFAHIEDGSGRLQLFFRQNEIGAENLAHLKEDFDLGDFIEASGNMMRTRKGEISLQVMSFRMLAKAITPLPAAKDEVVDGEIVRHATLSDPEMRYRQRYADLAVNPDVRKTFRTRTAIVRALQRFFDERGFLEVETPILHPIYGGAAAKPFVTHHNQLKQDLYLRISFELYLKRLLVGMYDGVYEIGRDFRNEGVSFKHNPEFTQLEFYWAYADYLKVMELTEQMIAYVCDEVLGTRIFTFDGKTVDVNPPWKRVELRQGLIDAIGIDIYEHPTTESLVEALQARDLPVKPDTPRGKIIDDLLGEYLEPNFIQPTFLYDYPREISPLAKSKPGNPMIVERFEGFMGGMELCNAFTELNDPLDQQARFMEMGDAYAEGDDERHPMDEDYLQAMSYGMPPNGGFGMGIDRLIMLLTDKKNIREVILFPPLREREDKAK
ncbi:MAG: lysine--tRNA ligase [Anaerolineaceae bacterium]|nr:lysine--tRNA ligase [Anaerolineaceae bacterium]